MASAATQALDSASPAMSVPFWPTLWPELVATVVGIGLGVPGGLWLNRIATRNARDADAAARRAALSRAALALRESITWNGGKVRPLLDSIKQDDIPFETPLEVARWEAVRDEFVRTAHDAELQGRVAFFFEQVRRAIEMIDRRFEFTVGVPSAMTGAREVSKALKGQLLQDLPGIEAEALELDRLLKDLE